MAMLYSISDVDASFLTEQIKSHYLEQQTDAAFGQRFDIQYANLITANGDELQWVEEFRYL